VEKRVPDLAPVLQQLLADRELRAAAIRGLAAYADEGTPAAILARYAELTPAEKQDAVATLAGRKAYALALLDGLEENVVGRGDVTAFTARQLNTLGDPQVTERLRQVWGEIRESPQAKRDQIAALKARLTPGELSRANLGNGRAVFRKTCQQCHVLYGEGGVIGPELTGSNRADLDYILSNIVDPSAEIGQAYQMRIVTTTDGRVLTGLIKERTPTGLVLQTATDKVVISTADVDEETTSPVSMMPEGQLDTMSPNEIRDLIGYLRTKQQVPLPTAGTP
jgi:putative heme-binding domain-containing protein